MADRNPTGTRNQDETTDARGRSYVQLDPVTMYVFRPIRQHLLQREDVIPIEPLRQMTREVDPRAIIGWWIVVGSSVLGILTLLLMNVIYFGFQSSWSRFSLVLGLVFGAVFIMLLVMPWFGMTVGRPIRAPRVLPVMLKHYRCPQCGYDLRNLPSDPADQATVCPECGCAWRLDATSMAEYAAVAESPFRPWNTKAGRPMFIILAILALAGVAGLFMGL